MIYLDNAATTFPKPQQVISSVNSALKFYSANPGRGGHKLSMKASKEIFNCRQKIAELFFAEKEEDVVFTLNCTEAINIVLKGYLREGDHVIVSCLEHNSVIRPLSELSKKGITYSIAKVYEGNNDKTVNSFREAINSKTKLIVCMHGSNVWGFKLPIERISALAHEYGLKIMVDAAQTAGIIPINIKENSFDFLCTAGHKGLMGPMGTGILITKYGNELSTLKEGGTGSNSLVLQQPVILPDKFESGTQNLPGIVGLKSGIAFVQNINLQNIFNHEIELIKRLYDNFSNIKGINLYTKSPNLSHYLPLLSFNINGVGSETVAEYLNNNFDIAVRAGLHCSPLAHSFMGTQDIGAVRISPSYFNNKSEIDKLAFAISRLCKNNFAK